MDNTTTSLQSQEQARRIDELAREARTYRESIDMNMYQLARVFTQAKELVPHGQWEKWLSDNADVSVRTAQDMIAAYKRFGDRPMFDSVGRSKLFKLLALPEGREEEFAQTHDIGAMSSREVEAAVKQARAEAAAEIERERAARIAAEKRAEEAENAPPIIPEELTNELHHNRAEIERLAEAGREGIEERNRLSMENAKLLRDVREKDEWLAEQQSNYEMVKSELLNLKSSIAKGEGENSGTDRLTLETLASAVRQFIGTCARLPQMKAALSSLDNEDRHEVEVLISTVEKWARESREALNTVVISGEVVA